MGLWNWARDGGCEIEVIHLIFIGNELAPSRADKEHRRGQRSAETKEHTQIKTRQLQITIMRDSSITLKIPNLCHTLSPVSQSGVAVVDHWHLVSFLDALIGK